MWVFWITLKEMTGDDDSSRLLSGWQRIVKVTVKLHGDVGQSCRVNLGTQIGILGSVNDVPGTLLYRNWCPSCRTASWFANIAHRRDI
jgi:hypothetical protein